MTYPTPPSYRMAYDVDGTKVFSVNIDNNIAQLTDSQVRDLNDNTTTMYHPPRDGRLVFVFPELRDVYGLFWAVNNISLHVSTVETSSDTTTLIDGTWNELLSGLTTADTERTIIPNYLTEIKEVEARDVRAISFQLSGGSSNSRPFYEIHLYGQLSPNQQLDKLDLWHPTEDEKTPPGYFDWGDTPRGSQDMRAFRVKNNSDSRTAIDITTSLSILADTTPSILAQHSLETSAISTPNDLALGDLGPGEISEPITIKRSLTEDAQLGPVVLRVHATPTSWG